MNGLEWKEYRTEENVAVMVVLLYYWNICIP